MKRNVPQLFNERGDRVGFDEVIEWWLYNYEGMEHLSNTPETFYTVTQILGKCFKRLKKIRYSKKKRKVNAKH